jgi:hypothetical protein
MGKGGFYRHTPGRPMISRMNVQPTMGHNFGQKYQGRWVGGWQAPGGWSAYRRPYRGYVLPSYWISPSFYVGNWSTYGFAAPAAGYGWSRYYDDAVMTDRYGRVIDYVPNYNWDRNATRSRSYEEANYDYGAYPDGYDGYEPPVGATGRLPASALRLLALLSAARQGPSSAQPLPVAEIGVQAP